MPNALKVVLAAIAGLLCGGVVNMAIVTLGPMLIPSPAGADMTTVEGITAAMPMLQPKHFVPPFLAHALGTLVSALVGCLLTPSHRGVVATVMGLMGLAGGIAASTMIPAPTWFIALDLIVAYLPMAWLGYMIAGRLKPQT